MSWPARLAPTPRLERGRGPSVRRESRLDFSASEGRLRIIGTSRDITTTASHERSVVAGSTLDIHAKGYLTPIVTAIGATWWSEDGSHRVQVLDGLVGMSPRSGFRSAVDRLATDHPALAGGTSLRAMLHDIPIVVMFHRAAAPPDRDADVPLPYSPPVDICAGYRAGRLLERWTRVGGPRRLGVGPPIAGDLDDAAIGPIAATEPEPGRATRRRVIDITGGTARDGNDDARPTIRSYFRDSVVESGSRAGEETVVHEYLTVTELSPDRRVFVGSDAQPIVLPGPDCSTAAASARWLVGKEVEAISATIRGEFTGTLTCTHLTDSLWVLGAVPLLLGLLDEATE